MKANGPIDTSGVEGAESPILASREGLVGSAFIKTPQLCRARSCHFLCSALAPKDKALTMQFI